MYESVGAFSFKQPQVSHLGNLVLTQDVLRFPFLWPYAPQFSLALPEQNSQVTCGRHGTNKNLACIKQSRE